MNKLILALSLAVMGLLYQSVPAMACDELQVQLLQDDGSAYVHGGYIYVMGVGETVELHGSMEVQSDGLYRFDAEGEALGDLLLVISPYKQNNEVGYAQDPIQMQTLNVNIDGEPGLCRQLDVFIGAAGNTWVSSAVGDIVAF